MSYVFNELFLYSMNELIQRINYLHSTDYLYIQRRTIFIQQICLFTKLSTYSTNIHVFSGWANYLHVQGSELNRELSQENLPFGRKNPKITNNQTLFRNSQLGFHDLAGSFTTRKLCFNAQKLQLLQKVFITWCSSHTAF